MLTNIRVIVITVALYVQCITLTQCDETPDVRFMREVGNALWQDRAELLDEALDELLLSPEQQDLVREYAGEYIYDEPAEPEPYNCAQCRSFVGTINGFIAAGNSFEDIRDQAVTICYGVTAAMGYNGTVMCEGLIDVFGPHVYYVLNVTDSSAREVCEFHRKCDPSNKKQFSQNSESTLVQQIPPITKQSTKKQVKEPIRSKENSIRIAHISDVHFDDKYAPGSATDCNLPLCCRDYWEGTGVANEWGDYNCGVPMWTVELMLQSLASHQPHVLMQTGDTTPHALWEETQLGQIWYSRWLAEAIEAHVPGVPAYTCIGNHDNYPTNLYYGERPQTQALNRNITEMYATLSDWTEEAVITMEIGGFYAMDLAPGLKVVGINSNFGTVDNFYGMLLPDSEAWLSHAEYIENVFIEADNNGDKIILLGHHTSGGKFLFYEEWIQRIIEDYGHVIIFQLQGHSHTDDIQLASNANLTATSSMFATSTGGTRTDKNPSYRIYYMDPETYLPLQYDHFYINLTAAIESDSPPEVELMYNSYDAYGLQDLSVESLSDFVDRLIVDDDLYYMYAWNKETRTSLPDECTGDCRTRFACDMRTTTEEREDQCRAQYP